MKDYLGQDLEVGDYVASLESDDATPTISCITSFTLKKVKLAVVSEECRTSSRYPQQLYKIDENQMFAALQFSPTDKIMQPLDVGDYVFMSDSGYIDPVVYQIEKLLKFTCKVKRFGGRLPTSRIRYYHDLLKVDARIMTFQALTKE